MAETKRIETDQLTQYFDAFSKRFLMDDAAERTDVEILDDQGDRSLASGVKLLGVDYDPHTNALELELESGDHRAFNPREVWAVEEPDGFISALQVVRDDGAREIVNIRRGT